MSRIYHVFVSHSWDHVDDLKNLRDLLENRSYFKVEFEEVPPHDPIDSSNSSYVKTVLKKKILGSDIVLGIAGLYASYSNWMDWELDTAKSNEIPIIGVIPRGQEHISKVVYSKSIVDVRWNTESIVDAIRTYAKNEN